AEEAACRMEHAIPAELVTRFVRFVEFVEMCPKGGSGLLEGFRVHLDQGCRPKCFDQCSLPPSVAVATDPPKVRSALTTLADLEAGQQATVKRVQGEGTLRRRLMDLGLIAGTPVTMERSAPLGDPLEILVRGTHLSLRRQEATAVQVDLKE
ncbi:MAG: metal-dependent transcriptional regulator, partial [bacterium]|nr:metal-dependent transcriptional regulator [bacterium]